MQTSAFLKTLDNERIVSAIRSAEEKSLGEIRVHVTNGKPPDVEAAARAQFEKLDMAKTALRNGVLIYVAPQSQSFAVIGDKGIHDCCGAGFWKGIATAMEADFSAGHFTDGIVKGVAEAGRALAQNFPRAESRADVNELPDDVTGD